MSIQGTGSKIMTRSNGDEDEDDIFKSAIDSPIGGEDKIIHGDEINLDDDDVTDAQRDNLLEPSPVNGASDAPTSSTSSSETFHNFSAKKNDDGPAPSIAPEVVQPNINLANKEVLKDKAPNSENINERATTNSPMIGQHIEITLTEPQKQGDGMAGFIVYRVTTKTNISLFRRKEFAVWRRFSDFLGLHTKLEEKYSRKGRIVPPAPEKNMMGTTKIKMSSGQTESPGSPSSDFIEKRRNGLERFINRVASHPVLRADPDFRDFLEIDADLPKSTNTSAFSGAGMVRLISKFGETVNKLSYKMDESDPWFEEKIQNIEALENQLRKVYGSVDLLALNRKELANSTGSFAKSAAILSNSEEHTSLARALSQLADVEEKVEQIHLDQSNSDFFILCELLRDYIALIGSIKEVFHERVRAYQLWQHAQQTLNKKRETKARLELQVRNDKLVQANEEVSEWEAKVENSQEEFNTISAVIKKELEQFEISRIVEFKTTIIKYLEALLRHQQELVNIWEVFLPEVKAIL